MTLVGLISDTHGLLRLEVVAALAGVDHIIHAGDVGKLEIMDELRAIAPVTAVRGNVDTDEWAERLPISIAVSIEGFNIFILHALDMLNVNPKAANIAVVVSGHTHRAIVETYDDVLYVNPGSAGPRRFSLPVSIGFLRLSRNAPVEAWLKMM
ncbi:MAG TPA: metallophosphoesterase family protein [Rhodomicrobium sp.]|nr:metallophosphoesterase family protein [Rhodomicrobium sp.]